MKGRSPLSAVYKSSALSEMHVYDKICIDPGEFNFTVKICICYSVLDLYLSYGIVAVVRRSTVYHQVTSSLCVDPGHFATTNQHIDGVVLILWSFLLYM